MDYAIFVSGDYEFISSRDTNKKIRLILSDEHYSIDKELISKKTVAFEEKRIVMYEWNGEVVNCFLNCPERNMTKSKANLYRVIIY